MRKVSPKVMKKILDSTAVGFFALGFVVMVIGELVGPVNGEIFFPTWSFITAGVLWLLAVACLIARVVYNMTCKIHTALEAQSNDDQMIEDFQHNTVSSEVPNENLDEERKCINCHAVLPKGKCKCSYCGRITRRNRSQNEE